MTLAIGDVFELKPPTVDHKKYFLCLGQDEHGFTVCLFLNSKDQFAGNLACDCKRFPMIKESPTGLTVVSLSNPSRYDDRRLALFQAKLLGQMTADLAKEIVGFCEEGNAKAFNRQEKLFVISRLRTMYETENNA